MPWPAGPAFAILPAVIASKKSPSPSTPKRVASFEPEVAAAIGSVVRRYRSAAGIAQDAFAHEAGVDRSYYGKLERGERQPSIGVLLRIARALQVPGSELLGAAEAMLSEHRRPEREEEAVAAAKVAVSAARGLFAAQRAAELSEVGAIRAAIGRSVTKKAGANSQGPTAKRTLTTKPAVAAKNAKR